MASTERLATRHRHSFDGSLRGIPATITPEVADTGIGAGVEEHREEPRVPPPQGATATSTERGARADQEEFRAASPKDAEKPTSKSEPRPDPEPHPTAASDESDELRIRLRKEREDAFPHNVTVDSGPQKRRRVPVASPVRQVVVTPPDHSQRRSAYIQPNAINSVSPPDDTRNVHTSDGEHAGCCIVCGFKLL
ncbi:hypothetical protein BKA83DRAFT_4247470 [Pisolithus microcarpus]|nr:hypothetical protein BKA83DRAFT_4247470 [Pisolithus microcarpus]